MRAILIRSFVPDPFTLTPTTVPIPQPEQDEYLVQITHCSPQHADILHAQGKHQNTNAKKGHVHPPFILGYDFAGTIVQAYASSTIFKEGDRVFGAKIGSFAEYIAVPSSAIRKVPDALSSETACAMNGQAVSYASVVHVAKAQKGETVLVSGASGGLGSACCMVAKSLGARVIALAGDEAKATNMRRDMDVDLVVVNEGNWIQKVMDFTDGRGVDAVLDNTGMVNDAIRCCAFAAVIVILGFAARHGVMEEVKMNKLLLKGVTVIGYRFGESGRQFPEKHEDIMAGYLEMLESGKLKPLLYGKYDGLESMGRALGDLAARKVYGKIVVSVRGSGSAAKL
jgi:NADPH2:quinone reductase